MAKTSMSTLAAAKKTLQGFEAKQNFEDERIKVRRKDNKLATVSVALIAVLAGFSQYIYFGFGPGVSPTSCIHFTQTSNPPVDGKPNPAQIPNAAISQCRDWHGAIKINETELKVTLFGNLAPQATANFIKLATQDGFYNSVPCTRLTTSGIFVLQCGDNRGDGTGDPGYLFGPIENAPEAKDSSAPMYKKGWLAMARQSNSANTMGSQFFIVYEDSKIPNDAAGGYTVFGEVTSGLAGLDPIIKAGTKDGSDDGKPKVKTNISTITLK